MSVINEGLPGMNRQPSRQAAEDFPRASRAPDSVYHASQNLEIGDIINAAETAYDQGYKDGIAYNSIVALSVAGRMISIIRKMKIKR